MTGLYIHIPFCKSKCPYCASYSRPLDDADTAAFIDAAQAEILRLLESDFFHRFDTVYIGGGTPTALSGTELESLLKSLGPFILDAGEVTCEANPESASMDKLSILAVHGVNRLSMGIQSFSDDNLIILGRRHDSSEAVKAFAAAREAGFGNISIDLMYGLPGQTLDSWMEELAEAAGMSPEHISFYGLTLEEGTEYSTRYSGERAKGLPSEDACREMYYAGIDFLAANGYIQYEISNFAKRGFESKHNLNYWRHGTYAAIGPSAAGFDGIRRWKNASDIGAYIEAVAAGRSAVGEEEFLTKEQLISEELMLGLRLMEGIRLGDASRRYDVDIAGLYEDVIRRQVALGLVDLTDGVLRLSRDGLFVSDAVMSEYMLV